MELNMVDYEWAEELLKRVSFLKDLGESEIKTLVKSLDYSEFKAGQTILFQGEISNRLYVVKKGTLSVVVSKKGQKTKVAELHSGDYFGEISLLEPTAATATIKSEEPTVVVALDGKHFKRIMASIPSALENITEKIKARREAMKPKEPAPQPEQPK